MRMVVLLVAVIAAAASAEAQTRTPVDSFLDLTSSEQAKRVEALRVIAENWNDGDSPMLIESARFTRDPRTRGAILDVLAKQTGQKLGKGLDAWYRWLWNHDVDLHPNYAGFKQTLYSRIDTRFAEYFSDSYPFEIRLDEIRWGGVRRDGIPPLKNPETISAAQATFLADTDVVFGVQFGGQARAYPKRILAWHEMVKDVVGGQSINGVYCTLCGSMIVYDTNVDGKHYELGTSGFLYRSNKLMYDHETKSMWSTLRGAPVVGPLVGKGIELKPLYVTTTTWGKWKAQHPGTDVLSRRTGHRRDYGEGVAYASYFATDELMFSVPKLDKRLKNKDEVLVVREGSDDPKVISAAFLISNRVYHDAAGEKKFVVLTDSTGANRVYDAADKKFKSWKDRLAEDGSIGSVLQDDGITWQVAEDALVSPTGARLNRLPAHRAFWFGWSAAFPGTKLVK